MAVMKASWDRLNAWAKLSESPPPTDWHSLRRFFDIFAALNADDISAIKMNLKFFNKIFQRAFHDPRINDPTYSNWENYRPLRLNREEGYSYWLAHLIATSESGIFAHLLLGVAPSAFHQPDVRTEVTGNDKYRADIVIFPDKPARPIHLEVKVGDPHLEKTYETGQDLEKTFTAEFSHFILLADWQVSDWEHLALNKTAPKEMHITPLIWSEVSWALRKYFVNGHSKENLIWNSVAWSFIGAIEQNLMKFQGHWLGTPHERQLANCEAKLDVLERSLK